MMTRNLAFLGMLAGALGVRAGAQTMTAEQVLERVRSAYGSLKAVHLTAERDETTFVDGRPLSASSECELAAAPGNR